MDTKISPRIVLTFFILLAIPGMVFGRGQQGKSASTGDTKPALVIGIETNPVITDYKTNYLTQYMEKLHNVNLDFYLLPSSQAEIRTKVSLMASANDLPDTIMTFALSREAILDYGTKGVFIALNRYFNDPAKTPNWSKIPPDDKNNALDHMIMADGNIYGLPNYIPETWGLTPYRLYFNRAWAEKLGIKVPATTEELKSALIAFRDRDPNGNGRQDELGLYGWYSGTYGENTIAAIMNAFEFWYPGHLALDSSGSTVIAPFTTPGFRKGIQYLNSLYREKVLSASLFTNDQQQFRATLNNDPPIVGITSAGSTGNWPRTRENSNYLAMAPMIAPLAGPEGVNYSPYRNFEPDLTGFITSKCSNPDLAFKFNESFFDNTLSYIVRWGEEGVDWSRKPEDVANSTNAYVEMGLYPALTMIQLKGTWTEPNNKHWHNVGPQYLSLDLSSTWGGPKEDFRMDNPSAYHNATNYQLNIPRHPRHILPLLHYTLAEAEKNSMIIPDVNEYVNRSIAEFVIGARDITDDGQWNEYLKELENIGLKDWLESSQQAYVRQKKK
jgi:putative aldouronate transport system substrate-binding protein